MIIDDKVHAYANGHLLDMVYAVWVRRTGDALTVTIRSIKDTDQGMANVYAFVPDEVVEVRVMWAGSGESIWARAKCESITVGYDVQDVTPEKRRAMPYVEAVLATREQPLPDWR